MYIKGACVDKGNNGKDEGKGSEEHITLHGGGGGTKGSREASFLSKVISLTCWKLDPADIGLSLIIELCGANSLVFIYGVYDMKTMCMYIRT